MYPVCSVFTLHKNYAIQYPGYVLNRITEFSAPFPFDAPPPTLLRRVSPIYPQIYNHNNQQLTHSRHILNQPTNQMCDCTNSLGKIFESYQKYIYICIYNKSQKFWCATTKCIDVTAKTSSYNSVMANLDPSTSI